MNGFEWFCTGGSDKGRFSTHPFSWVPYGVVPDPAGPQLCGVKKLWFASVVPGLTEVWASCVVIS
jgi:hypothetical protein